VSGPGARNIELKARVADLVRARLVAERLSTAYLGIQHQRDTYFACPRGRLKLREIEGHGAQLIFYQRPDEAQAKASDYQLVEINHGATLPALRALLGAALGITVVVEKSREIFLHKNVRIHLDKIAGLGTFVEFEAVVGGAIEDIEAREQVAWLQQQFQIDRVWQISLARRVGKM